MTDQYPNIKEEFSFDAKSVRHTKFTSRYSDSEGRIRKVGMCRTGEISDAERRKIYADIDAFIKAQQKGYDPELELPQ